MRTNTKRLTATGTTPHARRYDELRQLLQERRRELIASLQDKMKGVRAEHSAHAAVGVLDEEEASVVDVQEDLELALIEMKAQTLGRIDEAIARLDAGLYGHCFSCGDEIEGSRLRALPFAVRCRDCEEVREAESALARTTQGRGNTFYETRGPAELPGPGRRR